MEATAKHFEELEVRAMDNLLPCLHKNELLTDIECRIIVCTRQLSEKQLALYKMIMSKNERTAAQLVEMVRRMTNGLHAAEKAKSKESDYVRAENESDSPFEANKNPMLNNTVIKCIFGFLPLDDIKKCRLVSRQWNSAAEVLLRKRAQIHFSTDGLRPETFLAVSKFSLPDLPFSAFKFSECYDTELFWNETELGDFFEKWGKNIKELNLENINIICAADPSKSFKELNVTSWFENASKIVSLRIEGSLDTYEDDKEGDLHMLLSLGKLQIFPEIKTFILIGNRIEISSGEENTRTVLKNIELTNITCKRDDEIMEQFRYNDFFDFSQAVTIKLNNDEQKMSEVTFDMNDQVFKNTDLLCFNQITIKNWKKAKGDVRRVELKGLPFIEKNHMKIQSLQISDSVIDLFALPSTLERIVVSNCIISCSEPFSLPNLQFLKLQLGIHSSSQLTRFRLEGCENLKELAICHYRIEETSLSRMFDLRSLPKSLQTLRIMWTHKSYLTDDWILEVPGLVVLDAGSGSRFSDYTRISKKFHTGTLVVVCYKCMNVGTVDIVEFLLANMKGGPKRIFIGMKSKEDDLHLQAPFEGSLFSNIVNEKSNYYEFENSFGIVGKAITRSQFLNGCVSVGYESIPFFLNEE